MDLYIHNAFLGSILALFFTSVRASLSDILPILLLEEEGERGLNKPDRECLLIFISPTEWILNVDHDYSFSCSLTLSFYNGK